MKVKCEECGSFKKQDRVCHSDKCTKLRFKKRNEVRLENLKAKFSTNKERMERDSRLIKEGYQSRSTQQCWLGE